MAYDTIYRDRAPNYGLEAPTRRQPTPRPDPCADPCAPRCPACGGLECLCRPRFFPGQLLTEDDLNRLIKYVVDKNKLHNRYLHGWGVACGLEVTCDACDPAQVVVRTGYALSPCGDDIVVCRDQGVNICELIAQCTPPRQTTCDPPYDRPPRDCRGGNNKWVLAVCYDERPSRGVTALLGASDTPCGQPCQCGGSAGCASCGGSGCGCGGGCGGASAGPGSCAPAKTAVQGKPRKRRQAECEPTQMCEGYRFVVYPLPEKGKPTPMPNFDGSATQIADQLLGWMFVNRAYLGPLLERLLCCVARAQELLGRWGSGSKIDAASAWDAYSQYAEALYAFGSEFAVHRCAFVSRIDDLYRNFTSLREKLGSPSTLDDATLQSVKLQIGEHDNALTDLISECFCAALLPPCPDAPSTNCVPLAVVTLRGNDCRVVDICNWEARKILITWRTVGYWLSWIPWHCVRGEIAKFCCGGERTGIVMRLLSLVLGFAMIGLLCSQKKRDGADAGAGAGSGTTTPPPPPPSGATTIPPGHLTIGGMARSAGGGIHNVGDADAARKSDDLFLHLLTEFDLARSGNAAAPAWYAIAARLADGTLLDQVAGIGNQGGVSGMRSEIAQLRDIVAAQQAQIDALAAHR